jgi:hypothetical protein
MEKERLFVKVKNEDYVVVVLIRLMTDENNENTF